MIKAMMFDFSGTLLRIEPTADWLRAAVEEAGLTVAESELRDCAVRLERFGACPGGPPPQVLPAGMESLWQERDLSAEQHRAAYTGLAGHASLPEPELADLLYDRSCRPAAWQPYPDAVRTLKELGGLGIPVAVVSNVGWDIRPVFVAHRLDPLIDFYLLSYEFGAKKPDPRIFAAACDRFGRPPGEVLMVGDDRTADLGAAQLGCPVHLVDHLPVDRRPDSLAEVLQLLD